MTLCGNDTITLTYGGIIVFVQISIVRYNLQQMHLPDIYGNLKAESK
jgi:hypothetical protein